MGENYEMNQIQHLSHMIYECAVELYLQAAQKILTQQVMSVTCLTV